MKMNSIKLLTPLLGLAMACSPSAAQVTFSSDFTGSADWNWTGTAALDNDNSDTDSSPMVAGTDQMVASFGGPANQDDKAYAYYTGFDGNSDGAGITTIYSSFEISFSDISNEGQNPTNNSPLFQIGTDNGNKSPVTEFSSYLGGVGADISETGVTFVSMTANVWSNGPDDDGTQEYAYSNDFKIDMTTEFTGGDLVNTVDVYANGVFQESIIATVSGHSSSDFTNITGYGLGVLNAGSNTQVFSGEVIYDNFVAQSTPIPEPGTTALLAGIFGLGFLLLRRR